jgi:hypothetical protein
MICGGLFRHWRSLRSFGGIEIAEDQKIAAFGSSYALTRREFPYPAKQELP